MGSSWGGVELELGPRRGGDEASSSSKVSWKVDNLEEEEEDETDGQKGDIETIGKEWTGATDTLPLGGSVCSLCSDNFRK